MLYKNLYFNILSKYYFYRSKGHDTPNRMLTTRQMQLTKAPPKGRLQRRARSNFKILTPIRGTGPTGSLRSSYHTARRAVQKDNLQRKNRFSIKFGAPLMGSYPALRDTILQIECRRLARRSGQKAPPKGRHQRRTRSNSKILTPLRGTDWP